MALSSGCNHVALVTQDLERFIDFYRRVFDAEVLVDMREEGIRHALVALGEGFCLHPFEFAEGNPHAAGSDTDFDRGHLDHLAINVQDAEAFELLRSRLVDEGATDGTLTDFGAVRTVWFQDPDGMGCEIATWSTGVPRAFEDRIQEPYGVAH
ncbi:MAG: VOC family protein [Actinomycetota bacterium]|nr:VOC family protein [Actinomycetota bacterium]